MNLIMNEVNPNSKLAADLAPPDDSSSASGGGPSRQAAILVVDDSRTMRLGLIRALNALDFRNITEAANGKQALELVLTKVFDLMLLDMEMPEMNGMEVLVALKANRDLSELPVIVISAADQMENAVKCIEAGAEDFLPTPFNPTLLRARVTTSVEKKLLRDLDRLRLVELGRAHELVRRAFGHKHSAIAGGLGTGRRGTRSHDPDVRSAGLHRAGRAADAAASDRVSESLPRSDGGGNQSLWGHH